MPNNPINILDELDNLSGIHTLGRDEIEDIMADFAKRILFTMRLERMSAWLLDNDKIKLISIGEFDIRTQKFTRDSIHSKALYPSFFEAIFANKTLVIEDALNDNRTKELSINYLIPNNVASLMNIPIRIEGKVIGVMCFEKTGLVRVFDEKDQTFAYSLATVFGSNLEARYRRAIQHQLKEALEEKELLIQEINHRVKNNFSILIGLLRISKEKSDNPEQQVIFEEFEKRIFSMLKIHELLYKTKNYTSINLSVYLNELTKEFQASYHSIDRKLTVVIPETKFTLPTRSAIHIGLIVTEIFINSIKYAMPFVRDFQFKIILSEENRTDLKLLVGDNGDGFDFKENLKKDTLGLHLIKNLCNDSEINVKFPRLNYGYYEFAFQE